MPLPGTPDQRQYPSGFFTGGSLAYLVGMNSYRFVPALDSPKNDCLGLEQVLQDKHGFKPTHLFDAERQGVLDLLEKIKQECKPDSRVIFYYAGHGIADGADEENERPKGFLLAVDSERGKKETYIEMAHVLEVLVGLPCSHLLIILDCCYAGAIRYAEQTRSIGSSVPKTLYAEKFTYYISNPAKQVITSAACDQKAMDALGSRGELNANRRSPFAESLIRNLERGDQDWNFGHIQPDGIITASELGYFLSMEVSDSLSKNKVPFAEQQTPSVFRIGDRTKGEFIFVGSQKAILQLKPNPKENPWKGLADYSINDNHLFYGRQRVLDGWWEGKTQYKGLLQLVSPGENTHKILVTGRSGSGKSSLVKAGVLARLQDESPGSVTIITPGNTPFDTHSDLLKQLKGKPGKAYLMVDQYEELVTVCSDPTQQREFEKSLAAIAALPDAKVIITLRSDLERRFVDSPFLDGEQGGAIYRFVVPPFSREEIRETVTQPAIQQLLEFRGTYSGANGDGDKSQDQADERFVNRIIDETFVNPDSLPLLSFALTRLFEMKNPSPGNLLLETDYDDFGGISGILDKKLTDAYDAYDPEHQALFRQLIYRMISFDAGYMAKRRVYTNYISGGKILNELAFTDAATMAAMSAIQQELVKQRLLKTSRENEAAGTKDDNVYFEPAHEALLRSSNLISQWQSEPGGVFQGRIILLNAISAAAKNYFLFDGKGKKGSLWKDDPRLDLVKRMWNSRELYLNSVEETFIVESLRARAMAKRILWTVVITVITLLTAASLFSYRQKLQAENQLAENYWTSSQTALAAGDNLKSYLLLGEAFSTGNDESKQGIMHMEVNSFFPGALLTGLITAAGNIQSFEVSANSKNVVIISDTGASACTIVNQQEILSVKGRYTFAHLTADGKRFYTGNTLGLTCWDVAKKIAIRRFDFKNSSIKWLERRRRFVLSQDDTAQTRLVLLNEDLEKTWALPGAMYCISGDETKLAIHQKNGDSLIVYDISANTPKKVYATVHAFLYRPAIDYTGRYIGGEFELIDTKTNRRIEAGSTPHVQLNQFNPRGDKYIVHELGSFHMIDLNSWKSNDLNGDSLFDENSDSEFRIHFMPDSLKRYKDSILVDYLEGSAMMSTLTGNTGTSFIFNEIYNRFTIYDQFNNNFVSYGENGCLRICSQQGKTLGLSFMNDGRVEDKNIFVFNDGRHIATAAGPNLYIYVRFPDQTKTIETGLLAAYFSHDGKYQLQINKQHIATICENSNGRYTPILKSVKVDKLPKDPKNVNFNLDGSCVTINNGVPYTWGRNGNSLLLIDFKGAKAITLGKNTYAEVCSFNKDGNRVLFCDDGYVWYYNLLNNKQAKICKIPIGYTPLALNPVDGSLAIGRISASKELVYQLRELDTAHPDNDKALHPLLMDMPNTKYYLDSVADLQYLQDHKLLFIHHDQLVVYDTRLGQKKIIITGKQRLLHVGLSPDKKYIFACSYDKMFWLIDARKFTTLYSFRLDIPEISNYEPFYFSLNAAATILAVSTTNVTVALINLSTGRELFRKNTAEDLKSDGDFDNMNNYYFFSNSTIEKIGVDADEPQTLFNMEAKALTGSRLKSGSNDPEAIPIDELIKLRTEYEKEAAAHYEVCKYKPFNIWKQLHPGGAN